MKHNTFFKALVLALLVAGGVTFTSCVKQKNCQATRKTFIVEGELHYVSDEEAYLKDEYLTWDLEPSDIPPEFQEDGIMVRASLLKQGIVMLHDIVIYPYQVKCIESME